ncbi:MAG: hypothetical protein AB8B61_07655 [Cyclobacteriaceae bacterium]
MLFTTELLTEAKGTRNCVLHFFNTSSEVVNIKMDDYYDLPFQKIDRMSFYVDMEGYEAEEGKFPLTVYFEGEPIALAALEYNLSEKDLDNIKKKGSLFGSSFAKVATIIAKKVENPHYRRYHMYFYKIQQQLTHIDDLDSYELSEEERWIRKTAVNSVNDLLFQRLISRGFSYQKGEGANDKFLTKTDANGYLSYLSEVYMGLVSEFFTDKVTNTINVEDFKKAYTMYVNGSLKLDNYPFTQPFSAFCFLFTELAMLCIELKVDKQFWEALLPTLVMGQEIYATVYKPKSKPPFRFRDYTINNFSREKQYSQHELETLNHQYEHKVFDKLINEAADLVFYSFTGNFVGKENEVRTTKFTKIVGNYIRKNLTGE